MLIDGGDVKEICGSTTNRQAKAGRFPFPCRHLVSRHVNAIFSGVRTVVVCPVSDE